MKDLDKFIGRISSGFSVIGQVTLVGVMLLIIANIVLRRFAASIPGTVEMVELGGALILASSVAYCLYSGGHIFVDVLVQRLSIKKQSGIDFITSLFMLILNSILSWQSIVYGMRMNERGFVTGQLEIPTAPVVYVMGIGFFFMVLINITHIYNSGKILIKGGKK